MYKEKETKRICTRQGNPIMICSEVDFIDCVENEDDDDCEGGEYDE